VHRDPTTTNVNIPGAGMMISRYTATGWARSRDRRRRGAARLAARGSDIVLVGETKQGLDDLGTARAPHYDISW